MIWYLDHSAIAVETNNHLLLFDLFGKTLQPPKGMGLAQGFVNPDELLDKDVVIIGVSNRAEIWNAERWAALEAEELNPENLAAVMEELGF